MMDEQELGSQSYELLQPLLLHLLEHHNVREIVQADDSSYEALVDKISYKDAFKD